jgi:hypothetical protein
MWCALNHLFFRMISVSIEHFMEIATKAKVAKRDQ